MTNHKQLYDKPAHWTHRIKVIADYHYNDPNASISNTASYFRISRGLVSESLQIYKNFEAVKKCKNRTQAIAFIRALRGSKEDE